MRTLGRSAVLLLLVGCGKDAIDAPATGSTTPAACDAPVFDELELDPDGPDTQIHAASAATEDGVWVAWNRPDDNGLFDVFLGHVGCDGTMDVGPLQVDDSPDNEIDPALAVLGDEVLVAWQADDGSTGANLSIRWRLVGRDGTLATDVQRLAASGSAWMPAVATGDDGFVLAGSWAGDAVWEAFSVAIDGAGQAGAPTAAGGDPGGGQFWPSVTVDAGEPVIAFEQDDQVWWTNAGSAPVAFDGAGVAPSMRSGPDGTRVAWSDPSGGLWLAPLGGTPVALDVAPGTHFGASVVGLPGGEVAVAWYTNDSGLQNKLTVARFDATGAKLDQARLGAGDAPPYGTNLSLVREGLLFLAWQTGDNPDYRAVGQFVEI